MQNRALGVPGLCFLDFGRILEEADFSCFFDRQKVGNKSENSGMLATRVRPRAIFGSGLRQGGGPRRGKERTSFPISADAAGASGKYENQVFFVRGLGEGEFRGIGRIGIGRVGGRSLDIEKASSGRDLARRHKGDGGSKGYRLRRRPHMRTRVGNLCVVACICL